MAQIKYESVSFTGVSGEIKADLITPAQGGKNLAVVYPGAGYSCKQPLLYYGIQALLKKGYQVIAIDKVYADDPSWCKITSEIEARAVVETDAVAVLQEISERFPQGIHTLYGRSLGTYSIACALEQRIVEPKQIVWQTPALGDKWEIMRNCGVRSFGILGTADHFFAKANPFMPVEKIVIEGADHAMEIEGDPMRSIEILKQVTEATYLWLQ